MKIFISGPMSAHGNYNFPLFDHVAQILRAAGHEVFNPADHAREKLGSLEYIQKMDKAERDYAFRTQLFPDEITWICREATGLIMLAGWEHGAGARIERQVALYFNKPVVEADILFLIDEQDAQHLGALALDLASGMT